MRANEGNANEQVTIFARRVKIIKREVFSGIVENVNEKQWVISAQSY